MASFKLYQCWFFCGLFLIGLLTFFSHGAEAEPWLEMRKEMIRDIEYNVTETAHYIGKGRLNSEVMASMGNTPRHEFVPDNLRKLAYANRPLPIGYQQTISQPYIVALMTNLLESDRDDVVLEVGTGSGYQAAILAPLVKKIFTIEIIEPLASAAKKRLKRLGYSNVEVKNADGFYGWPEQAPFDRIIVTAAGGQIPPPLLKQLSNGGRMVIPVGSPFTVQYLLLIEKDHAGEITTRHILPVRFVPLTRRH